jgi:hypothetical protein
MSDTELLQRKPSASTPATEVGAGAPNPALCEVGALVPGFKGGWCLVRPIPYCPLGFCYGDGYLCRHPEIERIIARTQARKRSSQAPRHRPARHKG